MTGILRSTPLGVALLAVLGAWSLMAHPAAPEAGPAAAACVVLAAGLLAGRLLGRLDPAVPGLLVTVGGVGALAVTLPESLSLDPLAPPLGYMNANGALLLCGAVGAVVAAASRSAAWHLLAALLALVLATAALLQGAQAAAVGCVAVAAWAIVRGTGPTVAWVALGAVAVVVPAALPVAWGAGLPRPGGLVAVLSEERFDLWHEAWRLTLDHPGSGIGPGRFSEQSPTAADPDLAWAHSYVLQTGAELGLVGVALLALVLAWAVAALGRDAVLAGIVLLPASVDYVLHFGAVLAAVGVVVGAGIAAVREDEDD